MENHLSPGKIYGIGGGAISTFYLDFFSGLVGVAFSWATGLFYPNVQISHEGFCGLEGMRGEAVRDS